MPRQVDGDLNSLRLGRNSGGFGRGYAEAGAEGIVGFAVERGMKGHLQASIHGLGTGLRDVRDLKGVHSMELSF